MMLFDPANPGKKRLGCECCKNPWSQEGPACLECVAAPAPHAGLEAANLDVSVSPGANFFRYANGGWMDANPVPKEYPAWNSFFALHDANLGKLRSLMEETDDAKVRDFWASANDEDAIEAAGLGALDGVLAVCDGDDVTKALAELHALGVGAVFSVGEGPDDEQSSWTLLQLGQGGLGLPDRDYYFDDDKKEKLALYETFVAETLGRLGLDAALGPKIVAFEKAAAFSFLTRTEMRDPKVVYNKYSPAKLAATCKGAVDWKRYVELVGVPEARRGGDVNVSTPAAVAASCRLFGELDADVRKAYLKFHCVKSFSPHLSKVFVDAHFDFYSRKLSGQQEQQPRWKRCLGFVDAAMGELVAQVYVAKYFPESRKQRCLDLVERVRAQLEKRLKEVEWMTSEETRRQALEKMNGFGCKIGFPDKWVDYGALSIVAGDHLGNVSRARRFDHALEMGRVDKETDKTKWEMLPHQINAYYHPNLNEIVFPAAILQPPFFDAEADDATNLGAMGVVVGHEMTHGFDDQGRQYDASGNLRDWWTADDAAEYEKRVQVMVDQAETFEVEGKPLNGRLTCGENIADLGGLALAFAALEASGAKDAARVNGFTAQQRLFLAYATLWRENTTTERALKMLALDPHGPNEWRTNGPLSNLSQFHDAFGVGAGDALFRAPDSRVMIW